MQAKLLRVLQEEEVRPVGGKEWIKVDARVLAATNKDLDELMKNGVFREDLYYRLKVVTIRLPPIRERPEDIVALAQHFLRRYSQAAGKAITGISEDAMERLQKYSWPGNIRQLENAIEQAVVLSNHPILTLDDFAPEIREDSPPRLPLNLSQSGQFSFPDMPNLEEVKKRYVLHVMSRTEGNVSQAARILEIDRRSLYRMLVRWKIEPFKEQ
jgi:DNA-binding NtrC family response regulator